MGQHRRHRTPTCNKRRREQQSVFRDSDGSYQLSVERSGRAMHAPQVEQPSKNSYVVASGSSATFGKRPSEVSADSWWQRPELLPSETETAMKSRAQGTTPTAERAWYRYRKPREPVVGPFDVKAGTLVFPKMIGDEPVSIPLNLKEVGRQAYLHFSEQLEDISADIIVLEGAGKLRSP